MRILRWVLTIVVVAWLVLVLVAAAVVFMVFVLVREGVNLWLADRDERRLIRAGLLARCDQQHQWVLDGDPRGVYGEPA